MVDQALQIENSLIPSINHVSKPDSFFPDFTCAHLISQYLLIPFTKKGTGFTI